MFGSKIRSWMENHIVRPKKNKNKNKNGNCMNNSTSSNIQNTHKGTSYQCDPTLVSPARRSEVSPIPSDKTSRVGWQSPQENYLSPKSEFYPYHHQIKSNTSSKITKRKGSCNLEEISPIHQMANDSKQNQYLSKTMNANYQNFGYPNTILTDNGNTYKGISTESITKIISSNTESDNSLPKSNNYPHIEANDLKNMNIMMKPGISKSVSSSSTAAISTSQINEEIQKFSPLSRAAYNRKKSAGKLEAKTELDNFLKHQPVTLGEFSESHNPLEGYDMSEIRFVNKQQQEQHILPTKEESKYGKILTSNRLTTEINKKNFLNDNNANTSNSNFYYYQQHPQSHEQRASQNYSNNHHHTHHSHQHNNHQNKNDKQILSTYKNSKSDDSALAVASQRGNISDKRNLLRTNRYSNSTLAPPNSNHPIHIINSLSSPESAYSTGYSTDGTSPGASYTPEYYINMRTGTHYFPKNISYGIAEVTSRLKFGINKIDEAHQESTFRNNLIHYHKRTESFDLGQNVQITQKPGYNSTKSPTKSLSTMSPYLSKTTAFHTLKAIESPSPRQRCRIRTNPWILTSASSTSSLSNCQRKSDFDSASTSSGVRSSSDTGNNDKRKNNKMSSDSDSSTTTEDFSTITFSPNTIRRRQITSEATKNDKKEINQKVVVITSTSTTLIPTTTISFVQNSKLKSEHSNSQQESDEDTTLQEMMGKYDESYIYEKETDILSDSDQTSYPSDLDTGQDAEDECDTDDLLEIDYIDTSSIQEICDKDKFKNTGNCTYYHHNGQQVVEKRNLKPRRSRKLDHEGSKRRKKLVRRKKTDTSESSKNRNSSPASIRECRSVGGTPICLRRNQKDENQRKNHMMQLSNRSNSLTFTQVHSVRSKVLAIAESEKALIKADLEADVKYKQLIHEAETILVSLKSNIRDTPVASPRRTCNLPANKRVEILRNCEIDLKRELGKPIVSSTTSTTKITDPSEKVDNLIYNKRLELLRYETTSAPNSPKACRFSPRKTHVTNFINQNVSPTEILRRKSFQESYQTSVKTSVMPTIFINNEQQQQNHPPQIPQSPKPNRKFNHNNSNTKDLYIESSDSDNEIKTKTDLRCYNRLPRTMHLFNKENQNHQMKTKDLIEEENITDDNDDDAKNNSIEIKNQTKEKEINNMNKPPLMSFRSLDIRNSFPDNFYCPQSEPLKRKIYTGISSFDKLPKNLDIESEIPKQALLIKISQLRNQRRANKALQEQENLNIAQAIADEHSSVEQQPDANSSDANEIINNNKRQLILDTLKDLKQSLEDQSVELYGLNDTEE